jgi:Txe/YoeB family toxin of Txe-Axe toxin-antitoxin module
MNINPPNLRINNIIKKYELEKLFAKQTKLFEQDYKHPSLHTEKLEPKELKLYSFRLDKKWRVIFIYLTKSRIEIIDVNPHYYD